MGLLTVVVERREERKRTALAVVSLQKRNYFRVVDHFGLVDHSSLNDFWR